MSEFDPSAPIDQENHPFDTGVDEGPSYPDPTAQYEVPDEPLSDIPPATP